VSLALDADVLELAHRPQAADVGGEVAGGDELPYPALELEQHGLGLDAAVALDADVG
jgi:hypothetical protein